MRTKEFITELAGRTGKTPEETTRLMELFVSDVTSELEERNTVNIQEFGQFEVRKKSERISVNPTTKQRMLVPPKLVLAFKPHNKLKEKFK